MPVIGTAGHVDHGKSTLVQALTGIDPDRLREEKERGLTIDLGFAWLQLPSGVEVGIIDVPGHERFIKNMLAGAGGVDLALLVVAADEGPRPQTAEHLAILDLLDVPAGIVVITKCDLVEPEYIDLIEAELAETLKGSRMASAPVVRVSAATGVGLDSLRLEIDRALAGLPAKRDHARPRLPIDRVFTVKGFGAVVTGTLIDGWFEVGQEVEVLPGGQRARIRGIQRHQTKVEFIGPGNRTAVNLSGVHKDELHRGMTIARPGQANVVTSVVARIRGSSSLGHSLGNDAEVTVLCATAEAQAKVRLLDAESLGRGRECWAQVVLSGPMPAMVGDHIILRTPNETAAGGKIFVINGRRLRRNDAATLEMLERRRAGTPESRVLDALGQHPLPFDALPAEAGLERGELQALVEALSDRFLVYEQHQLLYSTAWFDSKSTGVSRAMGAYFEANPLRSLAPREHVRGALNLAPAEFDLVVERMVEKGALAVSGSGIAPPLFLPRLSEAQSAEIERFLAALRAGGVSPPTDATPSPALLAYLVEQGLVVDTGAGVVFEAATFEDMARRTRARILENGSITMAEARDLFGNSRKYAQAFLEHLDALHITRRSGDVRTLR